MSLAGLPPAIKRRARQREEARRAILDASESIVLEGGFEALSIRRLSALCGYAAPTIYHYFRDKPAIVDALLEERCRRLVSALRRVRRGRGPLADAHALYGAFARFGRAHPAHYRLLTARRDPGPARRLRGGARSARAAAARARGGRAARLLLGRDRGPRGVRTPPRSGVARQRPYRHGLGARVVRRGI
jgi:AcrR family transcriptional regulator